MTTPRVKDNARDGLERDRFFNACRILMNIDKHELVERGIMHTHEGGNDWSRFNDYPLLFLAKLDEPKADALWDLIDSRQGKRLAWPFEAAALQASEKSK